MQTIKTISNISYNTPDFLKAKLRYLEDKNIIDYWAFFPHKPEELTDPEADPKPHNHLMIKPSHRIQTKSLELEFIEPDPASDKPLKVLQHWNVVNSFGDWWLYAMHDPKYLKHKRLERKYHYSFDDCICSDKDTFIRLLGMIDYSSIYKKENIFEAASNGISYKKAMAMGIFGDNPQRYALMYKALLQDYYNEEFEIQQHDKQLRDLQNIRNEIRNDILAELRRKEG